MNPVPQACIYIQTNFCVLQPSLVFYHFNDSIMRNELICYNISLNSLLIHVCCCSLLSPKEFLIQIRKTNKNMHPK